MLLNYYCYNSIIITLYNSFLEYHEYFCFFQYYNKQVFLFYKFNRQVLQAQRNIYFVISFMYQNFFHFFIFHHHCIDLSIFSMYFIYTDFNFNYLFFISNFESIIFFQYYYFKYFKKFLKYYKTYYHFTLYGKKIYDRTFKKLSNKQRFALMNRYYFLKLFFNYNSSDQLCSLRLTAYNCIFISRINICNLQTLNFTHYGQIFTTIIFINCFFSYKSTLRKENYLYINIFFYFNEFFKFSYPRLNIF